MADPKGIRAGRAFVEMGLEGVDKVKAQLASFGAAIKTIGSGLALNFAVGSATGWINQFADGGREIFLMSRQLQMSTDAYQQMRSVAKQLGIETETMGTAIQHSRRYLAELGRSGKETNETMDKLGLKFSDLAGKDDLERLQIIGERLKALGRDETALIGRQIFGRGGTSIAAAAGDIARAREIAEGGRTQSPEAIAQAFELSQALLRLEGVKKAVFRAIGDALAPLARSVVDGITPVIKSITAWVDVNKPLILQIGIIGGAIAGAGTAILGLSTMLGAVGMVGGTFMTTLLAIKGLLLVTISPLGIAIGLVAALGYALVSTTNILQNFRQMFGQLGETVNTSMAGIVAAIEGGDLGAAFNVAIASMKVGWYSLNDSIRQSLGVDLIDIFYSVRQAWVELTAFMSSTWTRAMSTVHNSLSMVARQMQIQVLIAQARAGRITNEDRDRLIAAIVSASVGETAAAQGQTAAQLAAIEAERVAARLAIAAAAGNRGNDQIGAQIDLQNAIEAADIARAQRQAEIQERIGSIQDGIVQSERGGAARGTFNREAISGFGGNPLQVIAQRAQEQINQLEELNARVAGIQPRVA